MTTRTIAALASGLALTALTAPTAGHDFWIEPSSFRPRPDERVEVRLRVGEGFLGDALPRDPDRLLRFEIVDSAGGRTIPATPLRETAGAFRVARAGAQWLVYESRPTSIELDAPHFADYLREVGLERIVAERERRGESRSIGRERYARYAKSLLAVGGGPSVAADPVGLRIEIVPDGDPSAEAEMSSFTVLFDDEPLPDALVIATAGPPMRSRTSARTDARGRVQLPLDRPGAWLLTTVHMVRAAEATEVEWESFWASLTLARGSR